MDERPQHRQEEADAVQAELLKLEDTQGDWEPEVTTAMTVGTSKSPHVAFCYNPTVCHLQKGGSFVCLLN